MKHRTAATRKEENYFRRLLDEICPASEPVLKVYKVRSDGKQVCVFSIYPDDFKSSDVLNHIRNQFGPGSYLLRTVHSNGRFGPSRVVHLG
jgi:hypothetical protein